MKHEKSIAGLDGNVFNRKNYSVFSRAAVIQSNSATACYEASMGVVAIADILSIQADEEAHAADDCPNAFPLNQRTKDGLLCALRACARILEEEMLALRERDDMPADRGQGGVQ